VVRLEAGDGRLEAGNHTTEEGEQLMRDHKKLRAFELADELAVAVYQATRVFPREEQFGLTSQMRRAAVSTASNIVEGCARHSERDYVHFLDIAYGSCRELEYQVSLASRLGFIKEDIQSSLAAACEETSKVLNGLIRSLRG
jgi:four helix bundle protein